MSSNTEKLCGFYPVDKWDSVIHRSVDDFVRSLAMPSYEGSSAYRAVMGLGDGVDFFMWEAEKSVLGRVLKSYHQRTGDCVSMGWGRAAQDQMLVDIAERGEHEEIPVHLRGKDWFVATEPGYAGSRVEIGGGRLRGAGSLGSWHARWSVEYGTVFRQKYGSIDLTTYSSKRADDWGRGSKGCPDQLESIAKQHPIADVSPVKSWDAARDALAAGNSVPICSSRGFTTTRRDGFCEPRGTWNHCMLLRGFGIASGGRHFGVIQNSWGNGNPGGSNKLKLESGRVIELPPGSFAAEADVIDRYILRPGDCHVASGVRGFRRSTPDWVSRLI